MVAKDVLILLLSGALGFLDFLSPFPSCICCFPEILIATPPPKSFLKSHVYSIYKLFFIDSYFDGDLHTKLFFGRFPKTLTTFRPLRRSLLAVGLFYYFPAIWRVFSTSLTPKKLEELFWWHSKDLLSVLLTSFELLRPSSILLHNIDDLSTRTLP